MYGVDGKPVYESEVINMLYDSLGNRNASPLVFFDCCRKESTSLKDEAPMAAFSSSVHPVRLYATSEGSCSLLLPPSSLPPPSRACSRLVSM